MTATNNGENCPSPKQLAYLRSLADRAGQTFTYPRTAQQASREIRRPKAAQPSTQVERAVERRDDRRSRGCRRCGRDPRLRDRRIRLEREMAMSQSP